MTDNVHENCFCYIQNTTYLLSQMTSQIFLTIAQNCISHCLVTWILPAPTHKCLNILRVYNHHNVHATLRLRMHATVCYIKTWKNTGPITGLLKRRSSYPQPPDWLWGSPTSDPIGTGGSCPGAAADETWSPPLTPIQSHQQLHGTRKSLTSFIAWLKICCWKNHSLGMPPYSILLRLQNFLLPSIACLQRGLIFSLFSLIL